MLKHLSTAIILTACFSIFAQDIKEEDVKAQEINYEKPTEWSVYASDEPVSTFALSGDELWYAAPSAAYSASIKKHTIKKFPSLGEFPATEISCMAFNGNTLWLGGKNGAAMQSSSSKYTVFNAENGLPDNNVNALCAFGGKMYVGTDKGLACYSSGSWKTFTTKDGLSHDKVTAMVADNNGNLWVGTQKGISVYSGSGWTIQDMKKGMSWNNVKALAYDARKKTIWAAVGEKDVNMFKDGEWNTFMDILEDITSIMIDSQSRVWIGSTNGLMKYNGEEWISDPKQLYIPATQIRWMQRDNSGNLFYGCENGVIRLSNPYPF